MKILLKSIFNFLALVLIFPLAACSWLEKTFLPPSEIVYSFFAQLLALIPGLPGIFCRRAFYHLAVQNCSMQTILGFGTILVHRGTVIESAVSIGNYAIIGTAHIKSGCEIGSRVSIPSGKHQHSLAVNGKWAPFAPDCAEKITIHQNVWIGEGAIVMADAGEGSMIGAGAVVLSEVKPHIVVAGNPARFVRKLGEENQSEIQNSMS